MMIKKKILKKTNASNSESSLREDFYRLYKNNPIPEDEELINISLFMKRQDLSSLLFFNDIYKKIVNVNGSIIEFGVRWGKNLVLLTNLRGIYEPFNHTRKIIGFDTFEGFKSIDEKKDGMESKELFNGALSVSDNYEDYLCELLKYHEQESPISHIKKYEIVKGDATESIIKYIEENPQLVIAFAYFDFDIYKPTLACLNAIKGCLTKGSIVGFDQLNDKVYPGETQALKEVFGLNNIELKRQIYGAYQSYFVL